MKKNTAIIFAFFAIIINIPLGGWAQPYPYGTYTASGNHCSNQGYIYFNSWSQCYRYGSGNNTPPNCESRASYQDIINRVNYYAGIGSIVTADGGGYNQFLFNNVSYGTNGIYTTYTCSNCCWNSTGGYYYNCSWWSSNGGNPYSTNNVREEIIVGAGQKVYVLGNVSSNRGYNPPYYGLTFLTATSNNLTFWVQGTFNGDNITMTNNWTRTLNGVNSKMAVYGAIVYPATSPSYNPPLFQTQNEATFGLGKATTGQNQLRMTTSGAGNATLTSFFPATTPPPSIADVCNQSTSDDMKVGLSSSDKPVFIHGGTGTFLFENRGTACSNNLEFGQQLGGGMLTVSGTAGPVLIKNPNASIWFDESEVYPNTSDVTVLTQGSYIWAKKDFTYQNGGGKNLLIQAQGPCNGCNGYVRVDGSVNTTNATTGKTTIISDNNYVRIGNKLTHNGADSALHILTFNNGTTCTGTCPLFETTLNTLSNPRGDTRSYLWVGNDVNLKMAGDGNILFRSYADVVQLDDTVNYTDTKGGNLWIDGKSGVRTLGPTNLTNIKYDASANALGKTQYTNQTYNTTGQGFVTYFSEDAFIDFGQKDASGAFQAGSDGAGLGDNTPFRYTSKASQNALLLEGKSRVFFGDSVTIDMASGVSSSGSRADFGNSKIYAPEGWIQFADTFGYTGVNGDLLIYANGGTASNRDDNTPKDSVLKRSEMNPALSCDVNRGGFVLFDSISRFTVGDSGRVWVRSNYDDVVIGDMFTYENTQVNKTGVFVMQSGQDIYGRNPKYVDTIHFIHRGDSSILLEAQKSIHTQQNVYVDRTGAKQGDVTFKAGYYSFNEPSTAMYRHNASIKDATPSSTLPDATKWSAKGDWKQTNYTSRFSPDDTRAIGTPKGSTVGSDIWFEGRADFDLQSVDASNDIKTTLRAFGSIFIDSTFTYINGKPSGGDVLLYAETGNIEAAVTRQHNNFSVTGFIADDSVIIEIQDDAFDKEVRLQAGNKVWNEGGINSTPTERPRWKVGGATDAEYDGNILFNKPFVMNNNGIGKTLLSAARDIETQVMAPFRFTFTSSTASSAPHAHDSLTLTAGRHVETHALMQFNYPDTADTAPITIKAGRLQQTDLSGSDSLCKVLEVGSTLASGTSAFNPAVETGGVNGAVNNAFAAGGAGQGSILLFDSLEFDYKGKGKIYLVAENGNIESDPYLHRTPNQPANPGLGGLSGNLGVGYKPHFNWTTNGQIQHDAQITFNHGGAGITQLKAIDIKLHDKIAYYGAASPNGTLENGQFYITAYDSILTRNVEYVNLTDSGSVFITTDKYKKVSGGCPNINQGHIILGYGADKDNNDDARNMNDSIVFNFSGNPTGDPSGTALTGANVYIRAGYTGYYLNLSKGKASANIPSLANSKDRGKGYGGNITFDYLHANMAYGDHTRAGYMEISTPNGNIWGKDSLRYHGINGDLLVDAGVGSMDDPDARAWSNLLNTTHKSDYCSGSAVWRTGNIMQKGGYLSFGDGNGNGGLGHAIFRTREGFIDTYDAFTVDSMQGHLLKYASMDNHLNSLSNNYGSISERDFHYTPIPNKNSGSVFFGADNNIMLNYGNSNGSYPAYGTAPTASVSGEGYPGGYELSTSSATALRYFGTNPYYSTPYYPSIAGLSAATFDVTKDGYQWYLYTSPLRRSHLLYRGCANNCTTACGATGTAQTAPNGARDVELDFSSSLSGGFAAVASNYIDIFTKFIYNGGSGSGLSSVPYMGNLHGENVSGYGLYLKSQYNGANDNRPEARRLRCSGCGIGSGGGREWTYIGFHDDARVHTENQKTILTAPVVEYFGHAELDAFNHRGGNTHIAIKTDSLIFHDSVIFSGSKGSITLSSYTTGDAHNSMEYGVVNDGLNGGNPNYYSDYGLAITMNDRQLPVLELGYQRCNEPLSTPFTAPNKRSIEGIETTPRVGGDIIVALKEGYEFPVFNTVVANHARISFLHDDIDGVTGSGFTYSYIRTDLLRIRNKVEFYTDPLSNEMRSGLFKMATAAQMHDNLSEPGMYTTHLHTEPGSELSIPDENKLDVISETTLGGYGTIHEEIAVYRAGILAPGFASLMEGDCMTPVEVGRLTTHNLRIEKDAELRISIGNNPDADGNYCDALVVEDTLFTYGRIPVYLLPTSSFIEPGCYPVIIYGDRSGISSEYAKNFVLMTERYGEYYFALDYSQEGMVQLCVTTLSQPPIRRWVDIPYVSGVVTEPSYGRSYVGGHEDFSFTATFADGRRLAVNIEGYYSHSVMSLDATAVQIGVNTYRYTIQHIVEPWTVTIGPDLAPQSNDDIPTPRVWSYRNTLYIRVEREDVASIYNMTGALYKHIELPEGTNRFTVERGIYVVTLKDGSVHKIIIK